MDMSKLTFGGWLNRYYGPLWAYFDIAADEIWAEYYEYLYLDENENE